MDGLEELEGQPKLEQPDDTAATRFNASSVPRTSPKPIKSKPRGNVHKDSLSSGGAAAAKRRCVSTACIACRKRKSKCDGNVPSCAACSQVYQTECIYDPNSDHRRKGVYKKDIDNLKTRNSTLQTLIQAILNFPEHEVPDLVKQIRTCESLDDVAESVMARDHALGSENEEIEDLLGDTGTPSQIPQFEKELSGKMGKLRLDNGSVSIIGGTSNLIFMGSGADLEEGNTTDDEINDLRDTPATSWTEVTKDPELVMHLLTMYMTWHYSYFTTLSKSLFWRDFQTGKPSRHTNRRTEYCTPLLVNAMLALGCHFTSWPAARSDPNDSATSGDHFFREAKRLILENDEHENPRLATVQALALMSVREAGCGREARGWVYSGMSFRMAADLGLNIDSGSTDLDEAEVDARRITIWGCFLFDKCWSNYLGRQPQLPLSSIAAPKFDVFPMEDGEFWRPYMDSGIGQAHSQPSRTRAVALQTSQLCEISGDLLSYFYHPNQLDKPLGKQAELKKLSELHTRLEAWKKNLPKEMEPKEGQLPNVLVMHMFFQLLFIHLFRPFLKYKQATSPLPSHVSPRKLLIHSAATISKLLRLYKRTYGLRQICNIVVYIAHSACTVHLLALPEKTAARDIVHGLSQLEEIAESWLCARRTLGILHTVAKRWNIELPEGASKAFMRAESKYGPFKASDTDMSPRIESPPSIYLPRQNIAQSMNNHSTADTTPTIPAPPTASYLPNTLPMQSPTSTPQAIRSHTSSVTLPPQSPHDIDIDSRQQHNYILPAAHRQHQHQANLWQQSQNGGGPPGGTHTQTNPMTSPTTLFGGVQGLIQDQEWWLRDSNQFFANWNGMDGQETVVLGGFEGLHAGNGTGGGKSIGNGNGDGHGNELAEGGMQDYGFGDNSAGVQETGFFANGNGNGLGGVYQ